VRWATPHGTISGVVAELLQVHTLGRVDLLR
jgi:hypothetical protein